MPATDRVVVTGGAGHVGRHVARELRSDHDVRVADLAAGELESEFRRCDVLDVEALRDTLRGAAAVCHLGGLDLDVAASAEDFVRVNAIGTWNVLQVAAELGVGTAVLASSSAAYGLFDHDPAWTPQRLPVDESHEQRPLGPYSFSKHVTEQAGRYWARVSDLRVVALQPLHVVSGRNLAEFRRFVADAPSDWPHNYVVAADVARAFRRAIETPGEPYDAFLVGARDSPLPGPTLTWFEERFGALPEQVDAGYFARDPRASLFSTARAAERLGWTPELTLADLG